MARFRVGTAMALAAGLALAAGVFAQPPNLLPVQGQPKKVIKVQPKIVHVQPAVPAGVGLPVVPKSSAAFLSLKVSEVIDHPDVKSAMDQLKKNPEALDGFTELFGVAPAEIERITLFWPSIADGPEDPVVVVTTRAEYNEVRVLKTLKAEPVFGGRGRFGHGHGHDIEHAVPKTAVKETKELTPPPPPVFKGPGGLPGLPGGPGGPPGPPGLPRGPGGPPPSKDPSPDGTADTVPISAALPPEPLFYELRGHGFELLFLVDDRTLVFMGGGRHSDFNMMALFAQLLQKKQTGPLADSIASAGNHTLAGGIHLTPLFREFDRGVPRELAPYAALTAARTGTITGDLGKSAKFTVKLAFDDAAAARRAAPVMDEGLKTLAEKATQFASETKDSRRPGEAAMSPLFLAAASGMKNAAVKADGASVVVTTEVDAGPVAAKAVADLLQSVTSRKKYAVRANNLKQIGIALHSYHDANGFLPQNVYGPKGEPLLSWRVQILPYIEQDNLWRQFKMDEPWDSANNKKLIEKMPPVFEVVGRDAPKGQTFYQAFLTTDPQKPRPRNPGANPFVGRSWLVEGGKQRVMLHNIPDGTSNTLAVAEARSTVIWTKPDDIPFGEKIPPLGEEKADSIMVLMLDGSVQNIPAKLNADTLRNLIDGQDGMALPDDLFDDRRRRGGFTPRPEEPVPQTPIGKAPEAALNVSDFERTQRELATAKELLSAETNLLKVREAEALKIGDAVKVGVAPKAELEKAVALVVEARAVLVKRQAQVAQIEDRLRATGGSAAKDNRGSVAPVKK